MPRHPPNALKTLDQRSIPYRAKPHRRDRRIELKSQTLLKTRALQAARYHQPDEVQPLAAAISQALACTLSDPRCETTGSQKEPNPGRKGLTNNCPAHQQPRTTKIWWSRTGSNRRPPACKAGALPTELRPRRVAIPWTTARQNPFLRDRVPRT